MKSLRAEPTPLRDCIFEQHWKSDEEREQAMKEIGEWLDENLYCGRNLVYI